MHDRPPAAVEAWKRSVEAFGECGFSVRARKTLARLGITSREELMETPFGKLVEAKNCGPMTIAQLAEFCLGRDPASFNDVRARQRAVNAQNAKRGIRAGATPAER